MYVLLTIHFEQAGRIAVELEMGEEVSLEEEEEEPILLGFSHHCMALMQGDGRRQLVSLSHPSPYLPTPCWGVWLH